MSNNIYFLFPIMYNNTFCLAIQDSRMNCEQEHADFLSLAILRHSEVTETLNNQLITNPGAIVECKQYNI